jgi:hypothetical protein
MNNTSSSRLGRLATLCCLSLGSALAAQDTLLGPHGGTSGTAYELRAATDRRIKEITVYNGAYVDGFSILWGDRRGNPSGPTPVVGNTTGSPQTFRVTEGDYLVRVDVWATPSFVNQIRLVTARGVTATYGTRQTNDTRQNFPAGAQREIVGLFGHAGALVSSIGVVTRPVLASTYTLGFAQTCYTSRGTLVSLTLGPSSAPFVPGSSPTLLVGSLFRSSNYFMIYGVSHATYSGVPLPLDLGPIGAPNCTLRASIDVLVPLPPPDLVGNINHNVPLPNVNSVIGGELNFQCLLLDSAANSAGVVLSGALVGVVGAI